MSDNFLKCCCAFDWDGFTVLSLPNLWQLSATAETEKNDRGQSQRLKGNQFKSCFWILPQLQSCNKSIETTLKQICSSWLISCSHSLLSFPASWQSHFTVFTSPESISKCPSLCLGHSPAPCDFSFVTSGIVLGQKACCVVFAWHRAKTWVSNEVLPSSVDYLVCVCVGLNSALPRHPFLCTRALHVVSLPDSHKYHCAMISFITSCL